LTTHKDGHIMTHMLEPVNNEPERKIAFNLLLSVEERKTLLNIAKKTRRTQSNVLRTLLEQERVRQVTFHGRAPR
jgi:hypothetical protein